MDVHFKALADVGLRLSEAEEALDAGENGSARDALDAAEDGLGALRMAWPEMSGAERGIVGRMAAPLRERLDAARRRLPRTRALSEGAPEAEDDGPPEDEAG